MGNIRTHIAVIPQSPQSGQPHFHLTELSPISTNVEAKRHPLRVIAWGLGDGERVSVHMARVQSLGNPHWTLTDDCCPCPIEPGALANVAHLPYRKCGRPVVLTADEPAIHIDDAGTYYFEYHGNNAVIIDWFDDPIIPKNRLCDCDL